MQAIKNAICFICTAETLKKTFTKLISFHQSLNNHFFILLLDEPGKISLATPSFVRILYPKSIGLQEIEWKMIVFENNCSKACLIIMPHFKLFLRKKNYQAIIYIDLRVFTKKAFLHLTELITNKENDKFHLLQNILSSKAVIFNDSTDNLLMIYKNIWKDNDFFYRFYSDHTAISQEDRIKYINMHLLEKQRLDNPFNQKNKIRHIKQIVGFKKKKKRSFLKLHLNRDGTIFLRKYQLGIDNLIAQINTSIFINLSVYVIYKIIVKIFTHSYLFISGRKKLGIQQK